MNIDFETQNTWPNEVFNILENNLKNILLYFNEEEIIKTKRNKDSKLREIVIFNIFRKKYEELKNTLEILLENHCIIGYHCTRLTQSELLNISQNGLQILTKDLIKYKIENAYLDGHLPDSAYHNLINDKTINDSLNNKNSHRTQKLWFCPNVSTLKDHISVNRFFKSWGGELIYLEKEDGVMPSLQSIGSPYIIKCAIPIKDLLKSSKQLPARFISIFVKEKIEYPEPDVEFDFFVNSDVPAQNIIDIINHKSIEFNNLTNT